MNSQRLWTLSGLSLLPLSAIIAAEKVVFQFPDSGQRLAPFVEMVMGFSLIAILPALLLMCTAFVRLLVVFGILRNAIGTGRIPPNSVLIMLALMLTAFIMMPTFMELNEKALNPYLEGDQDYKEAISSGKLIINNFMLQYANEDDLLLFQDMSQSEAPEKIEDLSFFVVAPAFMLGELRRGFTIGFLLYIPFLLIDLLTASVLMSMGMMMLPPTMISLPIKLLLFVLIDGWRLLVTSLVQGFS
ncbi:MAG: flagellar type III secretion system pore protein FliP [Candidatus Zixiibacteriota bacterium]